MRSLARLTTIMLASLPLAALIRLRARTLARLATMMRTSMPLVGVRLGLDSDVEILARVADSADQDLVAVWPLALELLLLVVLSEGLLGDFVIEESRVGGDEGGLAGWVCAFDFGALDAADAVVVVVNGCLEDCSPFISLLLYPLRPPIPQSEGNGRGETTYHSARNHQPHHWHCPSTSRHWAWYQCGHRTPGL